MISLLKPFRSPGFSSATLWWLMLFTGFANDRLGVAAKNMTLDEARSLWNTMTQGQPSNYSFQYSESETNGIAIGPVVVDVRNDVVTAVSYPFIPMGTSPLDPADFFTVPDLFDRIDEYLMETNMTEDTKEPWAIYDPTFGYPSFVTLAKSNTEVQFQISNFISYTYLTNELEMMEATWESYDIETYEFVIETYCFCLPEYVTPKLLTVEKEGMMNSTVLSTIDITTGQPSEFAFPSVEELFQRIQSAIDDEYVHIGVTYDPEWGYPISLSTNPEYGIADAGIGYYISNMTVMNETMMAE